MQLSCIAEEFVGRSEADFFGQAVFHELHDYKIESPIEQLLYIAMRTIAHCNVYQEAELTRKHIGDWVLGLSIIPQKAIDTYRVDFLVSHFPYPTKASSGYVQDVRHVVVECDSQAWHERTEKERRYEKARDRHMAQKGYHVFRYTGKELIEDPFLKAAEVIGYVTKEDAAALYDSVQDVIKAHGIGSED